MARPPANPPSPAKPGPAERWLMLVAEGLDEMVWVWDVASGAVVYANPAFERFWGQQASEMGSGPELFLPLVHAEDRARLAAARQRLARGESVQAAGEEVRVTQPARAGEAARPAWLRERGYALLGPRGDVLRCAHLATDVTWQQHTTAKLRAEIDRRTEAERSLSQLTERLQALVDSASDAIITIDADSRVLDWNAAAERTFGWSRAQALGQDLATLIVPPEHREAHRQGLARHLRDGSMRLLNRRVETTALRRDGTVLDVELSIWPVRSGDAPTFSSFIRDISRRKAAARALADSEAKYRAVVENVGEGILVTAGGRILYANPKGLALTGLGLETATSRPFIEFIHPDDRALVLGNHMRRLRGEAVDNHYQFRVLHPDGSVHWLEISAVVFEWQGAPATLNFLTDVTQRRQVEQDMQAALARERELSELKSRFVAVASHEFRTPLAAILSSVDLLDSYGERLPAEDKAEMLAQIRAGVARMTGMIDQLLLTSRLETGSFQFAPSPQHLPQLLVQVAAEVDRAHPGAQRIAMACDGLDAPRRVDPQLLRHILVNLLGNALKYSPPDSPVQCRLNGQGDHLVITVADRGIGIPESDLPRLFETFHRGTNVGQVQGTGIGLYVVKACVDLHGGQIHVTSNPGQGTVFTVQLSAPPV